MKFLTTAYKNCVDFALIYDGEKQRKGCRAVVMVFEEAYIDKFFLLRKRHLKMPKCETGKMNSLRSLRNNQESTDQ